jgi:uncharacterized protein (TIGR02246 family)
VAAVQVAMKRYDEMVEAMNAAEIARLYAPTGEMVNGDTLVARGPNAVREYLQSFEGKVRVERNISRADEIKVEGDEATVRGAYQQRAIVIAEKRAVVARGDFVARWRRQGDGRWLIQRMTTTPPDPSGR